MFFVFDLTLSLSIIKWPDYVGGGYLLHPCLCKAFPFDFFYRIFSSMAMFHRLFGCVTVHCFHADAAACLFASICTSLQWNCAVERPRPTLGPRGSSCQKVEELLSRKRPASDQHSLHTAAMPLSHCIVFFEHLSVPFPELFLKSFFSCQKPWTGPGRLKRIGKAVRTNQRSECLLGTRFCLAFGFVEVKLLDVCFARALSLCVDCF